MTSSWYRLDWKQGGSETTIWLQQCQPINLGRYGLINRTKPSTNRPNSQCHNVPVPYPIMQESHDPQCTIFSDALWDLWDGSSGNVITTKQHTTQTRVCSLWCTLYGMFRYTMKPLATNDVMTRKRFQHYWPFVRWILGSPVNSSHAGSTIRSFDALIVANPHKLLNKHSNFPSFRHRDAHVMSLESGRYVPAQMVKNYFVE